MTNPRIPTYEEGKELSEQPAGVLVARLNFQTDTMSSIGQMMDLPEYQEMYRRGAAILPDIWADRENFCDWQNVIVQTLARDLGETLEFPSEIRTKWSPVAAIVLSWLERKVQSMQASE